MWPVSARRRRRRRTAINPEEAAGYLSVVAMRWRTFYFWFTVHSAGLGWAGLGWAGLLGWAAGLGWAGRRYHEVMAATQLSDTGIITNTNINCSNVLLEGGNLIDWRF